MDDNLQFALDDEVFILKLFIAGSSPVSMRAIGNLRKILEEHLPEKYSLEIIDAHQQPELVRDEDVTAIPMLIKSAPYPKRRLVGDFSDIERVLSGLGIRK